MRTIALLIPFLLYVPATRAEPAIPTFRVAAGSVSYTLAGRDPARGGTTTIHVLLVPTELSFEAKKTAGKPFVMDVSADIPAILRSPVFSAFGFPAGGTTQYADAMLRATFSASGSWHTLLGKPEVKAVKVAVPLGSGYVLTSRKSGRSLAIVDIEFLQKELFRQIGKRENTLVMAVTRNTAYYLWATLPFAARGERMASTPPLETCSS